MKPDRLNALINLLDDPEELVFQDVASELLKEDDSIIGHLEKIWETSLDELVQSRLENIIQQIQIRHTNAKIKDWANQKHIDLLEGSFLLNQYQYPRLKLKDIENKLNRISDEVWKMTDNRMTPVEKITVLNHILFNKHRFRVRPVFFQPENCYINYLLDTKEGTPVSFSILYILISRKLDFSIQYIDFPKTPVLVYIDPKINAPLFYIHPSNKGAIIGRKELDFFLKRNNIINNNHLESFCEDKIIIKKLLESLIEAYSILGNHEKVSDLRSIAANI